MIKCCKRRYQSRKIARQVRRKVERRMHTELTIYHCYECDAFHFTSMPVQQSREYQRIKQKQLQA
jgi:hypothetical protein